MDMLLVKIFATALALSQVTTAPDALKTEFDRAADQGKVVALLRDGCTHMRKVFEIEDINLDDLLATAMEDPDLTAGGSAAFRGIKFADLQNAYHQFCTNETVPDWGFDAGAVIDFYNKTLADLPDPARLKGLQLPGAIVMLDGKGGRFREVFDADQRRISVPLGEIPVYVQKAFVAAEDKRFYEHAGIDERGLIRAAVSDMGKSGHPQGASTITQQVVKNLLVGDDVSYERKIREIVLTARVERALSKDEILELYLNTIYLGRSAWGVEMAARSYFGKPAKDLTLAEGAMLAGLPKGPSYFSPDRYPDRMRERRAYVLGRMQEDGVITAEEAAAARADTPTLIPFEKPQRDFGFVFADQATREARTLAATHGVTSKSYTIRTTIDVPLQRSVEAALQEGLSRYERDAGRVHFQGPEANLDAAIARLEGAPKMAVEKAADSDADTKSAADKHPVWQRALAKVRLPLYDVHWTPAVVLQTRAGKRARDGIEVGLADGRILPLSGDTGALQRNIKLHDVIFVRVSETKSRAGARAELRVRPEVQGTAVVLENKTGRILAMTGGFSYPLSQLNRATQAERQPGSAIKPLSYLAALENGLQPNTLIRDEPITFPPIGGGRGEESWSPKNYEGGGSGILTLRKALENSRNLATVHLLDGGIAAKPEQSLDRLCALAQEMSIYRDCVRYYPFVLGAQPVRPIDLAAFYAAIANEGVRPAPHAVEAIEEDGVTYGREKAAAANPSAADRAAFYQLKTMMQGVLRSGTARALAPLSPYVAGKTGTTEDENDAWFVGFTNEITVAVWVGYDNAGEAHRTLGDGATGAGVAAPIFEAIVEAAWSNGMSKTVLAPPSAQAKTALSCDAADPDSGKSRRRASSEDCLRLDPKGHPMDARYRLVSRDSATPRRNPIPVDDGSAPWGQWREPGGDAAYGSAGRPGGWFGGGRPDDQSGWQGQRRAFWNW
ncbi:MAG TPA: PBP1A family penicillin-binding protein [Xanthobacteraceae bacterium]|nr:PBP1A family penicillin-binding protein [Xanthobacteraceae bacterium]